MTLPQTGGRGDIVVAVEMDPAGAPGVFTNWCGAQNARLKVANEIKGHAEGDCADWTLPVVTKNTYGEQDVSFSMDASWTAAMHAVTGDWALNQKILNLEIQFPNVTPGQVSKYAGKGMLTGLDLGGIGNTTGDVISEAVELKFQDGLTTTVAV